MHRLALTWLFDQECSSGRCYVGSEGRDGMSPSEWVPWGSPYRIPSGQRELHRSSSVGVTFAAPE